MLTVLLRRAGAGVPLRYLLDSLVVLSFNRFLVLFTSVTGCRAVVAGQGYLLLLLLTDHFHLAELLEEKRKLLLLRHHERRWHHKNPTAILSIIRL